jgi:branched-chain amino acid transport system ATP-binding protein
MIRMTKLEAQDVSVHFGGVKALEDVSIELNAREFVGLIGPNGAGKTTLVNVLSGFQRPTSGAAYLDGHDMTRKPPREFAKSGIARTFQAGRLFQELSVRENVQASAVGIGLGLASARKEADALLERLGLRGSASLKALILPFGLQRRVGIARALALKPRFLLLDEPAAGLNEEECRDLMVAMSSLPDDFGCTVLLIDHNIQVVMETCQRIHVIDSGRTLATGTPTEIRNNAAVVAAYFGSRST